MLKTTDDLKKELSGKYKNPSSKIWRMNHNREILKVKNGLYTTRKDSFKEAYSGLICGPSYVSFEKALARYNLIPEWVPVCTCATFEKNTRLEFVNDFGRYTYKDVPSNVFPYSLVIYKRGNFSWTMATPEKAICDLLYTRKEIEKYSLFEGFLFEGMRFDEDEFFSLDKNLFLELAPMYHVKNLEYLEKYVKEVM